MKFPGVLDRPEVSEVTDDKTDQKLDSAPGTLPADTTGLEQKLDLASGSVSTSTVDTAEVDDDQKLDSASGPLTAFESDTGSSQKTNSTENFCFNLQCLRPESYVHGGLKKCSRCSIAMYCSRECQAEHWRIHRTACGKTLIIIIIHGFIKRISTMTNELYNL